MSWSSWAKTLAKEAQRGIDIVLDIQDDPNAPPKLAADIEIGSNENITDREAQHNEHQRRSRRHSANPDVQNGDGWNDQWCDEQPKPVRRSTSKKTSPRSSRLKAKRLSKPDHEEVPPEPDVPAVNGVYTQEFSHDKDPVGGEPAPELRIIPQEVEEPQSEDEEPQQEVDNLPKDFGQISEDRSRPASCSREVDESVNEHDHEEQEPSEEEIANERQMEFISEHNEALGNTFRQMSSQLLMRENQIVGLSTSNANLLAENDELRGKVDYLEESAEESGHFYTKIESLEEDLHKRQTQLKAAKDQIATSYSKNHVDDIVFEKDEQIRGLMNEGEKLSKEQLTLNNTIKKLRTRVKETDEKFKKTDEKGKKAEEFVNRLEGELKTLQEDDVRKSDALRRLTSETEKAQAEIATLTATLEDNHEKIRSLEVTLDSAYKEIAELQRAMIAKDHDKEGADKLQEAKFVLQKEFDESSRQWELERHQLHQRIQTHQDDAVRTESNFSRREDNLKHQLSDYQLQLEESEQRNHELGQSIQSATRPLLRQIENLQATNSTQGANFETLEKTFQTRIAELQEQIMVQQQSDRSIRDTVSELRAQIKILERHRAEANDTQANLQKQLEDRIAQLLEAQTIKEVISGEYDVERAQLHQQVDQLRKDILLLESKLEKEKSSAESERAKRMLQERETQALQRLWNYPSQSGVQQESPPIHHDAESIVSEGELSFGGVSENILDSSTYSLKSTPLGPGIIETLQSQLKQREGELAQFRSDRSDAAAQREKLAAEVVRLNDIADRVDELKGRDSAQQRRITQLNAEYSALLTLYGEKVERVEELQYDLDDVKQLLRAQSEEWATLLARPPEGDSLTRPTTTSSPPSSSS